MRFWPWAHRSRIVALVGLGGRWVLDTANAVPVLANGFWELSAERGFHIGLWLSIGAFVFLVLTGRD